MEQQVGSYLLPGLFNLGGAAVVAAMFLVYLYKRGDKSDKAVVDVATQAGTAVKAFRDHNKELFEGFRQVLEQHFRVATENVKAIGELRTAVHSLHIAVSSLNGEAHEEK